MNGKMCQRYDPTKDLWVYETDHELDWWELRQAHRVAMKVMALRLQTTPVGPDRQFIIDSIRALREGRVIQTRDETSLFPVELIRR